MPQRQYLFVSYVREDINRVRPLVNTIERERRFRALPVDVWMDINDLRPGALWDSAITEALGSSIGFVFFISTRSLQSQWVLRELEVAARSSDRLIIPILFAPRAGTPTRTCATAVVGDVRPSDP
jgi:hypothetical protein